MKIALMKLSTWKKIITGLSITITKNKKKQMKKQQIF